jgi:hypothetical protein
MKAPRPGELGTLEDADRATSMRRARRVQVFADQYPYEASGTGIVGR